MKQQPTPTPIVPRPKIAKMMPRPKRKPKLPPAPPVVEALPAEPPTPVVEVSPEPTFRPSWERYSDALCILIPREEDPFEQYLMRTSLLKARYTPWKS